MDNNYCVYVHILPNDKKYYGMTKDVKNRWREDGRGYRRHIDFYNDILFYGWNNIDHIIVAKGLSKDEAEWLEEELIKTNKTYDSEYGYNFKVGSKFTDKTKTKLSESHKGKILSDETKTKISETNKGRILTNSTKSKISKSKIGINNPNHTSVICLTTNIVFDTIKEASNYYRIHSSNISACCKGVKNSAGKLNGQKLVWRYIDIIEL